MPRPPIPSSPQEGGEGAPVHEGVGRGHSEDRSPVEQVGESEGEDDGFPAGGRLQVDAPAASRRARRRGF